MTGAGLATLAGGLQAYRPDLVDGVGVIVGIDRFMSEGRAITNFTGSMTFVVLHLVFYGFWIVANLGWIPGVTPWDDTFVVLAMEASVEAIFLSTFVLINQNRQAAMADRRADLDLHVGLLAEDELTKLAETIRRIAEKLDVPVNDDAMREVEKNVNPERVLDALDPPGGERAG